jgi:hypothetical protein
MKKVIQVSYFEDYKLKLVFNNLDQKVLDFLPIIQKDLIQFESLNKLLDKDLFKTVQIGEMGELYWEGLIEYEDGNIWNYDISPELCFDISIPIREYKNEFV